MFNVYEISDDFDVFVAFETMNNRGKKLSNLELLKNRLIYLTTLYDKDELKDDEKNSLREKINDAWKEIYYQLGRNKVHPLNDDDFLIAHWIMYFQYSREKGDDYVRYLLDKYFTPQSIYDKKEVIVNSLETFEEIKEDTILEQEENDNMIEDNSEEKIVLRSKLSPKDIENYVNSLKSAALHWYNTYNPINNTNLSDEEILWIDRLNRIGIIYFRPLVTVTLMSTTIDIPEKIRLFKAIERFIFVTFRLSRAFSTYGNSEFFRAARKLRENKTNISEIISNLEKRMDYCFYKKNNSGKSELFFDCSFFQKFIEKKFRNHSGCGFYYWNDLRYFLYEYEMEKVRQRGSQKIDWKLFVKNEKDKVSIEHIFPQTPDNDYWRKEFSGYEEEKLKYLNGTIGNLLPLSMSINSSLQNDSFPDKKKARIDSNGNITRQGYNDGSHSEIEVSEYEEWNPKSIVKRGLKLIEFMENRWNIKFENEKTKLALLFIDFVEQD